MLNERLDEIGLGLLRSCTPATGAGGIGAQIFEDEEVRRATCRALNNYYADMFGDYPDRMTPVAVIPMHTPQEAIEELDYAVGQRGLKVVMLPSHVRRPVAAVAKKYPEAARWAFWLDTYGIDSDYDYDPVWAKCQELKVIPTFHGPGEGWGSRVSISNYVYNHVGHFGSAAESGLQIGLFLGGVTRRFPKLKFLFLEGGVGWALACWPTSRGHWEKAQPKGAGQLRDPRNLDREQFRDLYHRYGGKLLRDMEIGMESMPFRGRADDPATIDDFVHCGIEQKRATSVTCSCPISTSAARLTTRSPLPPSIASVTRSRRGSTWSSARTLAISTSPT